MNIGVLGAGSWGSSLSRILSDNSHNVTLWHHSQNFIDKDNKPLDNYTKIKYTSNLDIIKNFDVLLIALPSHAIKSVLSRVKINKNIIIVNC